MAKEYFEGCNFRRETLALIDTANSIIDEYMSDGMKLTLRQLYYQFVARDYIPNNLKSYKNLGNVINKGRMAGAIDWDAIEDKTRSVEFGYHETDPYSALADTVKYYTIDMWLDQPTRVEVWIEKEALVGVIAETCRKWDVPYFACRGYVSQSETYAAGKRIEERLLRGQDTVIIHLGDHDPSGIDMTRDNQSRLNLLSRQSEPFVDRIALNMNQIEEFKPPPNYAKITDSRAGDYISRFGQNSWELDALEPRVLRGLIEDRIHYYMDHDKWAERSKRLKKDRAKLNRMLENLK